MKSTFKKWLSFLALWATRETLKVTYVRSRSSVNHLVSGTPIWSLGWGRGSHSAGRPANGAGCAKCGPNLGSGEEPFSPVSSSCALPYPVSTHGGHTAELNSCPGPCSAAPQDTD